MANPYTQIYLQLVFSPRGHENVIPVKHKEELQKYTTGIIQNRRHKLLAINYMHDHVHIFIGYQLFQGMTPCLSKVLKGRFLFQFHTVDKIAGVAPPEYRSVFLPVVNNYHFTLDGVKHSYKVLVYHRE